MTEIIIIAVIAIIIGCAVVYIVKKGKHGSRCIGCPYSSSCGKGKKGKEKGNSCSCNK